MSSSNIAHRRPPLSPPAAAEVHERAVPLSPPPSPPRLGTDAMQSQVAGAPAQSVSVPAQAALAVPHMPMPPPRQYATLISDTDITEMESAVQCCDADKKAQGEKYLAKMKKFKADQAEYSATEADVVSATRALDDTKAQIAHIAGLSAALSKPSTNYFLLTAGIIATACAAVATPLVVVFALSVSVYFAAVAVVPGLMCAALVTKVFAEYKNLAWYRKAKKSYRAQITQWRDNKKLKCDRLNELRMHKGFIECRLDTYNPRETEIMLADLRKKGPQVEPKSLLAKNLDAGAGNLSLGLGLISGGLARCGSLIGWGFGSVATKVATYRKATPASETRSAFDASKSGSESPSRQAAVSPPSSPAPSPRSAASASSEAVAVGAPPSPPSGAPSPASSLAAQPEPLSAAGPRSAPSSPAVPPPFSPRNPPPSPVAPVQAQAAVDGDQKTVVVNAAPNPSKRRAARRKRQEQKVV